MTTLNRNRYRIAALIEEINRASYGKLPESAAAEACQRAGLDHQVASGFVAVTAGVEFVVFTAIEPACYTSTRSGWFVWWRRPDGTDVHHDGSVWCATLTEAIDIATRWAAGGPVLG